MTAHPRSSRQVGVIAGITFFVAMVSLPVLDVVGSAQPGNGTALVPARPEVYTDGFTAKFGEPCNGATVPPLEILGERPTIWLPSGRIPDRWWICDGTPFFMFSGIEVGYATGYENYAPDHEARYAAQLGGYTTRVNGNLVAVVPSSTDGVQHEVELIVGDVNVFLLAKRDVPLQRLLDLLALMPIPTEHS